MEKESRDCPLGGWHWERLKIRKLIGYLERDDPQYRRKNIEAAAERLKELMQRTEYMTVAQWIGTSCMAEERARRSSFWFGWWRAWRIRRKVRSDLRRIDFGGGAACNRKETK